MTPTPSRKPESSSAPPGESLSNWVREWVRDWNHFWFSPADPTTLAFMRLCCGVLLLYIHLSYSWSLLSYVGPNGWVDDKAMDVLRRQEPNYAPSWDWSDQSIRLPDNGRYIWSLFFHIKDPFWIWASHLGLLAVMALFTLGLWTRVTSALAWAGSLCFIHRAPSLLFGMDTMTNIVLIYLMIAPCGDTLSLDRWLARRRARRRGEPEPPVLPSVSANFAIRLTQVHFCIIYLAAGFSKLLGGTWWNGTAPSLVLLNYNFAPMDLKLYSSLMTWLVQHRWLWEMVTASGVLFTLGVEITLPVLIWPRRTRWLMISGSVIMHTAIGIFMGLVTFSMMMMVMLLAFMPPEVVRRQIDHLSRWTRRLFQPRPIETGRRRAEELALSR
jgi:hypothetical protein